MCVPQNGAWVLLDNANLCAPSVLDRLNALLEPGGTLLINESGRARTILPHPDFRMFFTVDEQHGGSTFDPVPRRRPADLRQDRCLVPFGTAVSKSPCARPTSTFARSAPGATGSPTTISCT